MNLAIDVAYLSFRIFVWIPSRSAENKIIHKTASSERKERNWTRKTVIKNEIYGKIREMMDPLSDQSLNYIRGSCIYVSNNMAIYVIHKYSRFLYYIQNCSYTSR